MSAGEKAVVVHIRGRVQGVGYRAWTAHEARNLALRGTVRNESDGRVTAVIAGSASNVDLMVERLRRGPAGAAVTSVECNPLDAAGVEGGFRILR